MFCKSGEDGFHLLGPTLAYDKSIVCYKFIDIRKRFEDRGFVIEEKKEKHRSLGHVYRATHIYFNTKTENTKT